jgi:hypothetical protein
VVVLDEWRMESRVATGLVDGQTGSCRVAVLRLVGREFYVLTECQNICLVYGSGATAWCLLACVGLESALLQMLRQIRANL